MTALTPLDKVTLNEKVLWSKLLDAEAEALKTRNTTNLIDIRVLGHLFEYLCIHNSTCLGSAPYVSIYKEITSCSAKINEKINSEADRNCILREKLYNLGGLYRHHIFRVFRSNGGRRLTPSEHPSRPSFEVVKQRIINDIANAPTSERNVKARALLRDGYRCTVSGIFDNHSCREYADIEARRLACVGGVKRSNTEVAHIFSESAEDGEKSYGDAALGLLKLFGLEGAIDRILGGNVNSLVNVLTMAQSIRYEFDLMNLWLEPVPNQPNTYDVCGPHAEDRDTLAQPPLERVTFTLSPDFPIQPGESGREYLPSEELLTLRAACSRVAWMSGATEHVDGILRELEISTVMSYDGGSAELLAERMSMVAPRT